MTGICRTCGTSLAEGEHGIVTASDERSVTFSCRFPRVSELRRVVQYLKAETAPAEYWYRARPAQSPANQDVRAAIGRVTQGPPSPGDVQRAHLDTFGGKP